MDEYESANYHTSEGGWLIGLIVLIIAGVWVYNHWLRTDVPWWNATKNQKVCAIHQQGNFNCYSLAVTAKDGKVTSMVWPTGGYSTIISTTCAQATSGAGFGRYCDLVDDQSREWEVQSN
jgi:hypothetical protein